MDLHIRISPSRVLEIGGGKLRLGSSAVVGKVEVRNDGLYLGDKLVVFRQALKCPVRVGGSYLCHGPAEVPRFFYRVIYADGLNVLLRYAELYATDRLNRGDCLAEYLYAVVWGAPYLWDLYYRKTPTIPRRCADVASLLVARGLRETRLYTPPHVDNATAALLGLLKFREALGLIEFSWWGLAVALRYGVYSALRWRLPHTPDMWFLLFGIYSALDPVVVPGGVAVDLGILRALPYLVARILGRWLVAFNSAGLYMAAGNFNMMTEGGRKRASYASCDGVMCDVGGLLFNKCVDVDCGIFRTWDFEFKGPIKCPSWDLPYVAVEPCK